MKVAQITINSINDISSLQSWFDVHPTVTVKFITMNSTDFYIFYTE